MEDFYDWSKTEAGGGRAIPLEVNDISLVLGGSYEYNGDWNLNRRHSFHRVGLSVDMEKFNTVDGEVIELTDEQIEKLTEFMKKYGGIKYDEEPIHYGFDGGN